jgi:hypothetical protein
MRDKVLDGAVARRRKIRASHFSIVRNATANGRVRSTVLLATCNARFYNTEIAPKVAAVGRGASMGRFEEFGKRIDEEVARLKRMNNFEEFGKRVDEELARVKSFVKQEVAPETEKRTAQFLREVSEKLSEAASWIEARNAARNAQKPPSS